MKKIALVVLTATVFSNAQMSMLSYMEASDASDNARAAKQAAAESQRAVEGVKGDVKMLARKVVLLTDSLHTLHVKLDSIEAQNKEILEILKTSKIIKTKNR